MKKTLLNLGIFQLGWFVCVLGGNLYALAYTGLALLLHHFYLVEKRAEWQLIFIILLGGSLWDLLMVQVGVIAYVDADILGLPLWLICLWALFATTFLHGLFWISRYLWLAMLFAAVFGPASYWAGSQLEQAYFQLPLMNAMALMAIGWALLFPAALMLARRYK